MGIKLGKYIFRRIRGRIIPILKRGEKYSPKKVGLLHKTVSANTRGLKLLEENTKAFKSMNAVPFKKIKLAEGFLDIENAFVGLLNAVSESPKARLLTGLGKGKAFNIPKTPKLSRAQRLKTIKHQFSRQEFEGGGSVGFGELQKNKKKLYFAQSDSPSTDIRKSDTKYMNMFYGKFPVSERSRLKISGSNSPFRYLKKERKKAAIALMKLKKNKEGK